MQLRRYQLWIVDPLTDDARPIDGFFSLTSAQRIAAVYDAHDECHRILEIRPIEVDVSCPHTFPCRIRFAGSGKLLDRNVLAVDHHRVVGEMIRRFGAAIDHVAVWLFPAERDANEPPLLAVDRQGKSWQARRAAS